MVLQGGIAVYLNAMNLVLLVVIILIKTRSKWDQVVLRRGVAVIPAIQNTPTTP